jgi:hypothetical protein
MIFVACTLSGSFKKNEEQMIIGEPGNYMDKGCEHLCCYALWRAGQSAACYG